MKKLTSLLTAILAVGFFTVGVSADEITKTFNMGSTIGMYEGEASCTYNFAGMVVGQSETETIVLTTPAEVGSISLDIEGTKNIGTTLYKEVKDTFDFVRTANTNEWKLTVLSENTMLIRNGELCPALFDTVNKMTLNIKADGETGEHPVFENIVNNKSFEIKNISENTVQKNSFAGIIADIVNANTTLNMTLTGYSTKYDYPILPCTGNVTQNRFAIIKLSDRMTGGVYAGFSSQVADFFDTQDNGKIIFELAATTEQVANNWIGNVAIAPTTTTLPATMIDSDDIALFFNYGNSTGTMISSADIDVTTNTITFDISDILADFGGLTKANLENIYYGLAVPNGIVIKNIILSYEIDTETITTTTEVTTEATTTTEVEIFPTDTDDSEYIPEEDEEWLDYDAIIVDDDVNPPTGVNLGLCGFGALFLTAGVALAAKKRK